MFKRLLFQPIFISKNTSGIIYIIITIWKKQKAVSYGQLELIPGIICDAYVRDVQL